MKKKRGAKFKSLELNRTFSKEEILMAKKTHEKILTISSNKGNAN
jgi:hypothetical protein